MYTIAIAIAQLTSAVRTRWTTSCRQHTQCPWSVVTKPLHKRQNSSEIQQAERTMQSNAIVATAVDSEKVEARKGRGWTLAGVIGIPTNWRRKARPYLDAPRGWCAFISVFVFVIAIARGHDRNNAATPKQTRKTLWTAAAAYMSATTTVWEKKCVWKSLPSQPACVIPAQVLVFVETKNPLHIHASTKCINPLHTGTFSAGRRVEVEDGLLSPSRPPKPI